MEQIKVKAAPGVRVPMENAHRKYITDKEAVPVNATLYYLLRLKEKDLVRAEDEPAGDVKPDVATAAVDVVSPTPAADAHAEASASEQPADAAPAEHNEVQ